MAKRAAAMRSLFLEELTTTEVEAYLKRGGRTALIPVGSVEMHGPHMPIGTDMIIARAFSARLAAATDGIVFPDMPYSWAGATEGFAVTVSVPPEKFLELVTLIAVKAWKMGFRRIAIVSVHAPNDEIMFFCVRRLFEVHGIPAQFLNPYRAQTPEAEKLFAGEWAGGKEVSMMLAALDVLGKSKLYSEKELAYDDPAPPLDLYRMGFKGVTGFFYQDKRHHVEPTRYTSTARGKKFFDLQVKPYAESIKALDKYLRLTKRQKNKGWFR